MPNFNQHPLTDYRRHVLGADSLLIPSMDIDTDYLVVPPPPVSPEGGALGGKIVRELSDEDAPGLLIANQSGADISDVQLVYKDGNGNEAIIENLAGPFVNGTWTPVGTEAPFFLTEDDGPNGGLFLRFTALAPVAANTVYALSRWQDVRGVERYTVLLPAGGPTPIFPAIPETDVLVPVTSLQGRASVFAMGLTGGPADVDPRFDDNGAIRRIGAGGTVLAGESLDTLADVYGSFHTNQNLTFQTDGPGVTAMVAVVRINRAPLRTDQGGAY